MRASTGGSNPVVVLLGSAQDGGIPHPACRCDRCRAAKQGAIPRRMPASLGIWLPAHHRRYVVDVTPELPSQLELLDTVSGERPWGLRNPVDGMLLTHGHFGHVGGMPFLGKEVAGARAVPTWCTPRLASYLRSNRPYGDLVTNGYVELHEVEDGDVVTLAPGCTVRAAAVRHRTDVSDTLAFCVTGPRHSLLYVPDVDKLDAGLCREVASVDFALVDGTFYSADELGPERGSDVPHPAINNSVDKLAAVANRVWFVHLNHTNVVADPASPAHTDLLARGFRVAADGECWEL